MTIDELIQRHQEVSPRLRGLLPEEVFLWYADLVVEMEGEDRLSYYCPRCGVRLKITLDEFLCHDDNKDLRCSECRGDLEERGGPG